MRVTSTSTVRSSTSASDSIIISPSMCWSTAALVRAPKPNFQCVSGAHCESVRLWMRTSPSCTMCRPSEVFVTTTCAHPPVFRGAPSDSSGTVNSGAPTDATSVSLYRTSMRCSRPVSSDTRRPVPTPSSPNA